MIKELLVLSIEAIKTISVSILGKGKYFVCRIKGNTIKSVVTQLTIPQQTKIVFFAQVYLGDEQHRTQNTCRLVGFTVGRKIFWVATHRTDLTALEIAVIYRRRWEIETFFAWWQKHLKVYHLIARSAYGLMMQLLSGLITYLLIVIYFNGRYAESPSLSRLLQLRRGIRRERAMKAFKTRQAADRIMMFCLTTVCRGTWVKQTISIALF